MIRDLGIVPPGTLLYIPFHTFDSNDPSASVTLTGLLTSDIEVYKDGSVTQRASDNGYALLDTDGIDFDGITGIHGVSIDLADNSTAGFYAAGSQYWVVIASVTVDAATVNFVLCTFRIGQPAAILNTTIATLASQTSFTLTAGPAEDDALNGCVVRIHDVASAVQAGHAVVADYTGSTKTVTLVAGTTFTAAATDNISVFPPALVPTTLGRTLDVSSGGEAGVDWANVGGQGTTVGLSATTVATVTTTGTATAVTTVNGLAANVITATSIAADAITAAKVAADVSAEIADAVWDEDATGHQTTGTFGQAIGDPVADTNTIYAAVVTGAAGATIAADIVDIEGKVDDLESRLGTPSDLGGGATVAANLADIEAQTDDIGAAGAGLTAVPWNSAWDAEVQSEVEDALVAHRLDELLNADSDIDGAAPPTVGSVFHELLTKTAGSFTYDQTTDSLEALRDRGDAAWITATGFSTHSAADVWAAGTRTLTAGTNIQLPSNGLANVTAWTVNLTGSLSGSVGSVTGNVGGNVLGNVEGSVAGIEAGGILATSFAAGAITAAAIAADAITAAKVAPDVHQEQIELSFTYDATATYAGADAGSLVKQIADNAGGSALTTDAIAEALFTFDAAATYATANAGSVVKQIADNAGGSALTEAGIADAVWDEARAGHTSAGSFGQGVASVQGNVTGSVASVTGAVGSIATGGIAAASFAAGAIDATAIATDAIGANEFAQAAADKVWATTARVLTAGTNIQLPSNGLANVTAWTVSLTGSLSGSVGSVTGAVGSVTGSVGSVTGAVGSVTGSVGGNVTGSVGSVATGGITAGSFAAGAIDAAAIAADAIGSSELAASAVTEIQSGLSTLTEAGVRTAVGLASANLDTQLAAISAFLDTEIAAILAAVDTEVGAIKTVTDQLVAAQAEPSAVPAANATPLAKIAWLALLARNKVTQTATTQTAFADNGSTTVAASTHADDATTHTRGEWT